MTTTPAAQGLAGPSGADRVKVPWASWTFLALAGGVVLFPLSYAWSYLENYSFGWWVPLLAVFVFFERWNTRPAAESTAHAPHAVRFILVWGGLFLFFRMALESSLSSRPLLWCCSLLYVAALLYWLWIYGGKAWARHFAFPACFLLISVPWPAQIEDPLVQGLQQFNAWLVANVLVIGGIYAQAVDNVIVLAHCTLGVEAACSGIRSLQAALMVAFLVGEFYRFAWLRRMKLVLLAIGLAMLGNFFRALFLALMASWYDVKVMSQWHDTAGLSILVFTSITTWLVAAWLNGVDPQPLPKAIVESSPKWSPAQASRARYVAGAILLAAILSVLLTKGWYAWGESGGERYTTWTASLPNTGNFRDVEVPEESRDILKYDAGRQVEWKDDRGWDWTAYWFRYHPTPTGETVFQAHNPDRCLPAVGFRKMTDFAPFTAEVQGIRLNVFPRQFAWRDASVYVFWSVYADRASFPMEKAVTSSDAGLLTKLSVYLSNMWHGRRASTSEMESLETLITGPADYPTAKAAYLTQLQKMIVPDVQ